MTKTKALSVFLVAVVVVGLAPFNLHFVVAQTSNVSGIVSSDAEWNKASSSYNLVGNVLVNNGVTLTIEAGTVVNFNSYYIRVNGTLAIQPDVTLNIASYQVLFISTNQPIEGAIQVNGILAAKGTSTNPIHINGVFHSEIFGSSFSAITFTSSSSGWNEQTGSGSIIENTIINSTAIEVFSSLKISKSTFLNSGIFALAGAPVISNSNMGSITIGGGSPIISNNSISGGIQHMGGVETNFPVISGNVISGCQVGIGFDGTSYGHVLIEGNLIINNSVGIQLRNNNQYEVSVALTIQNNSIANNNQGILLIGQSNPPTINNNNFENNSQYNILAGPNDINATSNWWGSTNAESINQTIYEFKNDFNLGIVNFVPFLTEPNPQAPAIPVSTPTPTPNTTPIQTSTPTQSQSPIPSLTPSSSTAQTPTPTQTPSTSPSQSPSTSPSPEPTSPLLANFIIAAIIVAMIAIAVGAFLLGKRIGRSSTH